MEEIKYKSDDHNLDTSEYFEWPALAAFCDEAVPVEYNGSPARNIMLLSAANNSLVEVEQNNIRAKISSHPFYPKLLLTCIDCHKVGAPPEIVNMLDNIIQENDLHRRSSSSSTALNRPISNDSELDEFMVSYSDVLAKFKLDLEMSFNEATSFLDDIQTQLNNLCTTTDISGDTISGGGEIYNEEQKSIINYKMCRSVNEIKDKLMGKYSGYISSLKQDFCKKNNKGKLPREATQILLNWWTTHYNWPYPTDSFGEAVLIKDGLSSLVKGRATPSTAAHPLEGDKVYLAESTGLDPKQINNWFINQRKRHWKPSENMQFAVMETIYGHFSQ